MDDYVCLEFVGVIKVSEMKMEFDGGIKLSEMKMEFDGVLKSLNVCFE